jgi:hypothetical protein
MNQLRFTLLKPSLAQSKWYGFIFLFFLIACLLAPISIAGLDTFYYWDWSRHLALSYFDGPPLIAYCIRLFTLVFGESLFSLNICGIALTGLATWVLYRTARLFLSVQASLVSTALWLFSPIITLDLLHQTTYDNPQALFWITTLYCVIKYLQSKQDRYLYLTGISIGFLLLSKYTGIVLVLGLLIFLLFSSYRYVYKSRHFYLAGCLSLLIFSPVLIWNYQHNWLSFYFQLQAHTLPSMHRAWWAGPKAFLTQFVPVLNVFLLTPIFCLMKRYHKGSPIVVLNLLVSVTVLFFYLYAATKVTIRPLWLAPYLTSAVLLAGVLYEKGCYQKTTACLIGGYFAVSVVILMSNNTFFHIGHGSKLASYHLIKQFNETHDATDSLLLTPNWLEARAFFFMKPHREVYTLDCGGEENQYGLWGKNIKKQLANQSIRKALYIDFTNRLACLEKTFDSCERIPTKPYVNGNKKYALFAYQCMNHA